MATKSLIDLGRNERGMISIWMALIMPTAMAAGAIAVDMSNLYVTRGQLQHTADAAVLAAVSALPDQAAATAAAQLYTEKNMPAATHGNVMIGTDVTSGNWNAGTQTFTPGASPLNSVRVVTRRAQANGNAAPTFFARALGYDSVDISASAIATKTDLEACVIALNPNAPQSFFIQGNASVRTYDCNIQVNSCDSSAALSAQGNVEVTVVDQTKPSGAGSIDVCGATSTQGPATLSPAPNESTGKQIADPFASVAQPDPTAHDNSADCDFNDFSATGDVDLYPGVYCGGISLTGNGTATFHATGGSLADGQYIIKDGPLVIAGNKNVVGERVGFFLTGASAIINFGGTADIGLSAPITGDRAGFVFFGDRDNPANDPHQMRGTALGGYNGYIYLPGARLKMQGTATGTTATTDCTMVVADRFEFSGTSNFEAKAVCSDYQLPAGKIALVN